MKTSKVFAVAAAIALIIGAGDIARAERGDMSPRVDSKRDTQNVLLQKSNSKREMFKLDSKREIARLPEKRHIAKLSTKSHKKLALGSKSLRYRG